MKITFAGVETTIARWVHATEAVALKGATAFLKVVPWVDKNAPTAEKLVDMFNPAIGAGIELGKDALDQLAVTVRSLEASATQGVMPLTADLIARTRELIATADAIAANPAAAAKAAVAAAAATPAATS